MIFQRPTSVLRYTWKLVSKCCTSMSFCVSNVKQYLNYQHTVDMDPSFLRRFCDHRHCTLSRDTECWSDLCEELRSTALIGKLHRESKKQDTKLLAITSLNIIRFSKFFTTRLGSKFATNSCSIIAPRFKHVAILPCKIWMQKNGIILKYVLQLMINHKIV